MNCSACQHENRESAKFREECAAPLKLACTRCGTELRPTAKFCDTCGQPQESGSVPREPAGYTPSHLAERIRSQQLAMEARGAQEGERKTITVLFVDLKKSTALLEGLDPEVARSDHRSGPADHGGRGASL